MARKYKIRDQLEIYFITFTTVQWVDVFTKDNYKQIVLDSLKYCQQNKGLNVHAYCFMTNHVHLILSVNQGKLSDVIRDLKSHTSLEIKKCLYEEPNPIRKQWILNKFEYFGSKNPRNLKFQLWQQHNHPIALSDFNMLEQRLDYLHMNPVTAGFISDPCAWTWSSCSAYEGGEEGLIKLEYLF